MNFIIKICVAAMFLTAWTTPVVARSEAARKPAGCELAEFHELDFWVGNWRVVTPDKALSANVTVAPILKGCALAEDWMAVHGNNGRGVSTYNVATHRWEYFWVAANGYTSFWTGQLAGNAMRFEAAQPSPGAASLRRWNLTRLPDGRIKEEAFFSRDGGKTWPAQYTLYWERIRSGGKQ